MGVFTTGRQVALEILMPGWWLSGASVDLDFRNNRYYDSANPNTVSLPTDMLSCSRASIGYAQTFSGTLTQFPTNTLRMTDLGLLREETATNIVLWNRDLTNAVWIKTNVNAALNQLGIDGTTNSASSITATAGNGTVLQSCTAGNSWRGQSAYVKRITGTGTINMTMDNGSTWTAITVTSNWTLANIPAVVMSNPTVGFRIVTSGDAIAIDFVQNEQGQSGNINSSPIATTTVAVTRAADSIGVAGTLDTLLQGTNGSVVLDFINNGYNGADNYSLIAFSSAPKIFWLVGNNDSQIATKATSDVGATFPGGILTSTGVKVALGFNASGRSLAGGNGTVSTDSDQPYGHTGYTFGGTAGTGAYAYYRRLTVWNSRLSDATLQALTAP